jgi:uncharacterized protein (TIGR03790 family)
MTGGLKRRRWRGCAAVLARRDRKPRPDRFVTLIIVGALGSIPLRADNPPPGPKPFPLLAPPPLTSDTPEAPPDKLPDVDRPAPATQAAPVLAPGVAVAAPPASQSNSLPLVVPRPPEFLDPAGRPGELAAHLLVVYNQNDPESESLARYYAQRRGIPTERVLVLNCPAREEITRDEFEQTIRVPVLNDLFRHNWLERRPETASLGDRTVTVLAATRNDIWAMVLMRGVPLKIMESAATDDSMEPQALLRANAAAVDSELAILPMFGLPLGGFVPNPFYDAANTGEVRAGPELAKKLILVTRLDGPTAADVRRMIDDCLAAEHDRLAGQSVIDGRGFTDPKDGYTQADNWLRTARDLLAAAGWPVLFDNDPATLPPTEPVNQVAFYLGWYSPDANGPWVTPPDRFVPGAIAYHLHSFSAATVRSATHNWVGPLIDHGADATMGNVYEPFLALTPHLDIFTKRMLDGDTFAEAAWASELGLSWMTTMVGDPLYRPFQKTLAEAIAASPPGAHRDWLRLQDVNRLLDAHPPATASALEAAFALQDAGPVLNEHEGDLLAKLNDPAAPGDAEKAYTLAMDGSAAPVDRIRIGLKLARVDAAQNQQDRAQVTLRALRSAFPVDAARFGVTPQMISSESETSRKPAAPFDQEAP